MHSKTQPASQALRKPRLVVTARVAGDRTVTANGREAQALVALVEYGPAGISSLEMGRAGWAIRLAAYVHDLKRMGVPIVTEREAHEGGNHGRYRLAGPVTIITRNDT